MAAALHLLLAEAARALAAYAAGRSLTEALAAGDPTHRAGSQAIAFAAVRAQGRCSALLQQMLAKRAPALVDALLRAALGQLLAGEAAHTVVSQAVQAARRLAPAQSGMVNAVLRRFGREREALLAQALQQAEARHEHPAWWVRRLQRDWPAQWPELLAASQLAPPFSLRVNGARGSAKAYRQRLLEAGLQARALGPLAPDGLVLEPPCPVAQLPGFDAGDVSVQDGAAQLAAPLLIDGAGSLSPLPPGARVLDACAAPGGKTAHLLERRPDLELLALDQDADRLRRVGDTLQRLGLQAGLRAADARQPAAWWDGRAFDAVLLDAPCSASGIVRRHPDVRWLRRESDLAVLASTQAELLDALWPLLKPGGRLLYAACSLFAQEGREQADAFTRRRPEARVHPVPGWTGHHLGLAENPQAPAAAAGAAFSVPSDGFFYALFVR